MEISKLLGEKQWPKVLEPSPLSAFRKYTRSNSEQLDIFHPNVTFNDWARCQQESEDSSTLACHSPLMNKSMDSDVFGDLPHRHRIRPPKKSTNDRRPRTTFSIEQTAKLEDEYKKNEYVSRSKRVKLAQALDLTEGQVKIWFQNRRAKDKRIEKAQLDQRVRFIALNMAAISCPSILAVTHQSNNCEQPTEDV